MKILLQLCLLLLAISCNQTFKKTTVKLSDILTIEEVEVNYQKADKKKLFAELRVMEKTDQIYRRLIDSLRTSDMNPYTKKQIDSIWDLQEEIDDKNTLRLIELTEKYGMLTSGRMNEKINPFFVFMHSDNKYCDTIMRLLDRDAKWIEPIQRHMLEWNLSGRIGSPFKIVNKEQFGIN